MGGSLIGVKLSHFRLSPIPYVHGRQLVGCSLRRFGFKQFAAAPAFADRVSVELPMQRALQSTARGRLLRVRAPEDRMDPPHCRARHTHCAETRDALFA